MVILKEKEIGDAEENIRGSGTKEGITERHGCGEC